MITWNEFLKQKSLVEEQEPNQNKVGDFKVTINNPAHANNPLVKQAKKAKPKVRS